jgi:hypothetical protein
LRHVHRKRSEPSDALGGGPSLFDIRDFSEQRQQKRIKIYIAAIASVTASINGFPFKTILLGNTGLDETSGRCINKTRILSRLYERLPRPLLLFWRDAEFYLCVPKT